MPHSPAVTAGPRPALGQRVRAAILEAAAGTLVERGERASLGDVAAAAGVARATVSRYFASRQALLQALERVALNDAAQRLSAARPAELPAHEGLARAVRALLSVGQRLVVLARQRTRPDNDEFDARIATPLRQLLTRAQRHGEIRDDVPAQWLTESLLGLIASALASAPPPAIDDTTAAITSVFLDGARAPDPH